MKVDALMVQQVAVTPDALIDTAPGGNEHDDGTLEVTADVAYRRLGIVNVVFVGHPKSGDREWVLIDAGIPGTKGLIQRAAAARFGADARPSAIVMTHGHFDHIGVLEELAEEWGVKVYVHELERPYLDGRASYPPADPKVGGGIMALLSPLYPTTPVNVAQRLQSFSSDGSVPPMPGWQWIHTPGHSPGHVSFWREADRTLIVGDAFVTTAQESAYAVATQASELHGPPMYLTVDWQAARESVRELAALKPERVVTGHGRALQGPDMRHALEALARDFDRVAVPEHGRYVETAARAEDGSAYRTPS